MKRLESKGQANVAQRNSKGKKREAELSSISKKNHRFSVSEAKSHLSAVLKLVQGGQSVIVTDHGKDVASIEGIQQANQLTIIPAQVPFSEIRDLRISVPEAAAVAVQDSSILELLWKDREGR